MNKPPCFMQFLIVLCTLFFVRSALAAGTYYNYTDSTYNDTTYPRKTKTWVPDNLATVRGILLNGNGAGGDNTGDATQLNKQAFCEKHDFILVATGYFTRFADGIGGNDWNVLMAALDAVATSTNAHPEIMNAPFVNYGFSNGGQMAYDLALLIPDRTVAFCANKGGYYITNSVGPVNVPGIFIAGEADSSTRRSAISGIYTAGRSAGAPWAWLEEENVSHEYGNSEALLFAFYNEVIAQRYPANLYPTATNQPVLLSVVETNGWLVSTNLTEWESGFSSIEPSAGYSGDKTQLGWVPSEEIAQLYRADASFDRSVSTNFSPYLKTMVTRFPGDPIKSGSGKLYYPGQPVHYELDIAPTITGWQKVEFFDGTNKLGEVTDNSSNTVGADLMLDATRGNNSLHSILTLSNGTKRTSSISMMQSDTLRTTTIPDALTASAATNGVVTPYTDQTFSWSRPTNVTAILGYSYALNQEPDETTEGTATSVAYTNLTDGTYIFKVRAQSTSGVWGPSASFTLIVQTIPDLYAPTGLTATAQDAEQVDLAWTDTTTSETGFEVERRLYVGTVSDVAVDDADSGSVSQTGTWTSSTNLGAYYGSSYVDDSAVSKGSGTFRFNPAVTVPGVYVIDFWSATHANGATNVPVSVSYAGGTGTVYVNQNAAALSYQNWDFNAEADGTLMTAVSNGGTDGDSWTTSLAGTVVTNGALRIRTPADENSYAGGGLLGYSSGVYVMEVDIASWNVVGTLNNQWLQLNLNTGDNTTVTVGIILEQNSSGLAFWGRALGTATSVGSATAPIKQYGTTGTNVTLRLVADFDSRTYEMFYRDDSTGGAFVSGGTGTIDPARNGGSVRLRMSGDWSGTGEFMDVRSISISSEDPVPSGGWITLGTYAMDSNSYVEVSNSGTAGLVVADAVSLSYVDTEVWSNIALASANATSYSDTSVSAETSYEYRVRAVSSTATSDWSNVASVTTPEAPTTEVVASGLLATWNLQTIAASPIVTATNASFLSTGLVSSATGGVLTHSYTNRVVGRANALAANFTGGYASLDAALSAGYYFKWTLESESDCQVTITNIQIVTEHENAAITGVLFCAASGLTSADELGRMPAGLQHSSFDTGTRIVGVNGPVEFRLYGYGDSSLYHAMMIGDSYSSVSENDIAIYGTIVRGGVPPNPQFEISTASVAVPEGGTAQYSLRLTEAPSTVVTVTSAWTSGDADLSITGGSVLYFNSGNWSNWQSVTVSAAEDADAGSGSAVFTSSASGLSNVTVTASETDNDTLAINLSTSAVSVPEGSTASFTVSLTAQPAAAVTVAVSVVSGDADITVSGGSSLVFNTANWNTAQAVTLSAAEDVDVAAGSAVIRCSTAGLSDADVTATESDNDTLAISVSTASVSVPEGSSEVFTVSLTAQPSSDVTVSVANISGDSDISVSGGSSLVFSSASWNIPQTVTLSAADDADELNGTATIQCSASGLSSVDVTATEADDDANPYSGGSTGTYVNTSVKIVDFGAKLGSGFYRGANTKYYAAHVDRTDDGTLTNDFANGWYYSETDPLNPEGLDFDTNSLSGVFYGGLTLYTVSDLGGRLISEGHMNQNHEFYDDLNLMTLPAPRSNELVEAYAVYYWPKQGFLNGGSDAPVSFDTNSEISVYISRYWGGVNAARWLVRDGDQFYLSENTFAGSTQQFDIYHTNANPVVRNTHSVNPFATRWAPYNPVPDTNYVYEIDFDASSATFADVTFTNVTAIGFFVERQLSPTYPAAPALTLNEPIAVKWNAVHATAVIGSPSVPSKNIGMASIGGGAEADFYMATNPVPYELWRKVFRFGVRRQRVKDIGLETYSLEKDGSMGLMRVDGLPHTGEEPVTDITWYDTLAWCNALSEFEGLEPCYYTDEGYTNVLRQIIARDNIETWTNRPTVYWKSSASGFRLPTAAEWSQMPSGSESSFWEYYWFPAGLVADPAVETVRTVLGQGLSVPTNSILTFNEHPWNGSPRITFRPVRNGAAEPLEGVASGVSSWSFSKDTTLPSGYIAGSTEIMEKIADAFAEVALDAGLADTNNTLDTGFSPWTDMSSNTVYALKFGGNEVPYGLWNFVAQWAVDNGYEFNYSGDMGSMGNTPGAVAHDPSEPVTEISWYDALVWCNALSEMTGRQPVYFKDAGLTNVWRQANKFRLETLLRVGYPNFPGGYLTPYDTASYIPVYMNTEASGYRMPLPQEWDVANVTNSLSKTDAYNWLDFNSNGKTHPVASKLPNSVGLYDMEGNVRELTWGDGKTIIDRLPHRKGSHFARGYRESHPVLDIAEQVSVGRAHVGLRTVRRSAADPVYSDFVISTSQVVVAEGASVSVQVHLAAQPAAAVTAMVFRMSGDTDVSVTSSPYLVFDSSNWSEDQTVTVQAVQDADNLDGVAMVRVSAFGYNSAELAVTESDDDSITTVSISTNVVQGGVKRFGINIDDNYWEAPMLKKTAEINFEGIIYRQCHSGTLSSNGFTAYWIPTNVLSSYGWDDVYTNGATFTILSGDAKGQSGRISRIETNYVDIYGNGTWDYRPFFVFETPIALPADVRDTGLLIEDFTRTSQGYLGENSYWKTVGTTIVTNDSAPGSFGNCSAQLDAASNATVRLPTSFQRQRDANGDWRVRFWAKRTSGTPTLNVDAGTYVTGTNVVLSDSWQYYDLTFTASGIPTPAYPASDAHMMFALASSGSGTVLVDDIDIWKLGDTNTTPFADDAVNVLKKLNPGYIRYLRMGGSTVTNAILPKLRQYGTRYNAYAQVGVYTGSDGSLYEKDRISIHEQAELCEEVGASPWFCLPGGLHSDEVSFFVDYLAGSTNTAGGSLRAELGHPQPWTEVFDDIVVEFGNEAWNYASSYLLGGFNGKDYWHDLIAAGKSTSSYTNNIRFQAAGQNLDAWMSNRILNDATNADGYAIAPYMLSVVNSNDVVGLDTDEKFFQWLLAYPLYRVNESGLPAQKSVMDATGVEFSLYEYNYHDVDGDAYTLPYRAGFNASVSHSLSIGNTMLNMLERYRIRSQCFFTLTQFSYQGSKLWGNVVSFRDDMPRYRPAFLALSAINTALSGDMIEAVHSGDDPTFAVTGEFGSDIMTTKTNKLLYSYAFKDGDTNALILINYDLTSEQGVHLMLPEYVANQQAQLSLLTAAAFTNHNEPDLAEPQVVLTNSTVAGFDHNSYLTVPAHSIAVYKWTASTPVPAITVSTNQLDIGEGGTASVEVMLTAAPSSDLTVSLSVTNEADGEFSLISGSTMTFTPATWNVPQTATVAVAEDALEVNGSADLVLVSADSQLQVALVKLDNDIIRFAGSSATVLFDFGSSATGLITTNKGWNNITNLTTANITNAVDNTGAYTGIGLGIIDDFQYIMTGAAASNSMYPASAQSDYFRVLSPNTNGTIQLTGIDSNSVCRIRILGSGTQDFGSETRYTVNGQQQIIDSYYNSDVLADFTNVVADASGVITITVSDNGSGIGVINLMQLDYVSVFAPDAPRNLDSDHATDGVATTNRDHTFSWLAPTNVTGIAGYSYALNAEPDNSIDTTGLVSTTYTNLADGAYFFYVKAATTDDVWGASAEFTLLIGISGEPPVAPSNFMALATISNTVALTWDDPSTFESGFEIERSDAGADVWTNIASPAADTVSWVDSDVVVDSSYDYRIRTLSVLGTSDWSSVASATVTAIASGNYGPHTLFFDFGRSTSVTTGNWNNVTSITVGVTITNVIDSAGEQTGLIMETTDSFQYSLADSVAAHPDYPASAQLDYFRVASPDTNGVVVLSGLDTGLTYQVKLLASAIQSWGSTVKFTVNGSVQTVNSYYNTNTLVVYSNVLADANGRLTVEINNNGTGIGVINLMQVDYTVPTPSLIVATPGAVTVDEGASNTFMVRLFKDPEAEMTVTVSRVSGDSDITVSSGAQLIFDSANWESYQTVTLSAAADVDFDNGSAIISCSAPGWVDAVVTAVESDDLVAVPQGPRSMLFDFGRTTSMATGNWNNVTSITVGVTITNAVNSAGELTGATLETTDSFQYSLADSVAAHPDYPASAQLDYFRVTSPDTNGVVVLSGLDTGLTYQVKLLASAIQSWGSTVKFTVNGSVQTVNSYYNTNTLVVYSNVLADANGRLTVEVNNNGTGIGVINLMDVGYVIPAPQAVVCSADTISVVEGGSATFDVQLAANPGSAVTVSVSRVSGDSDLSVAGGNELVFDSTNWNSNQTVTVSAAQDDDLLDGTAAIQCTMGGITFTVAATEYDDDNLARSVNLKSASVVVEAVAPAVVSDQTVTLTRAVVAGSNLIGVSLEADSLATLLAGQVLAGDVITLYDAAAQQYVTVDDLSDVTVPAGGAFWLDTAEARDIVMTGSAITLKQIALVEGLQIIANPVAKDVNLQDMNLTGTGNANPALCDKVSVLIGSTYRIYGLYTDGIWYKADDKKVWSSKIKADEQIEAGQGFWYDAKVPFVWISQ